METETSPKSPRLFWLNFGLTYLAVGLAYIYAEAIYPHYPLAEMLPPAVLKAAIVSLLAALSVLVADGDMRAEAGKSGLKQALLRYLGPILHARAGLVIPLAVFGCLGLAITQCRFLRLDALREDLRSEPLEIAYEVRQGASEPITRELRGAGSTVPFRGAASGEWPKIIITDAYGFRKKELAARTMFSWFDYLRGSPVQLDAWVSWRDVLAPLSVGVEMLDKTDTYQRYAGPLIPTTNVPNFEPPAEDFWRLVAERSHDRKSFTVRAGDLRFRGIFYPQFRHLELIDTRIPISRDRSHQVIAQAIGFVRRPSPPWDKTRFRSMYRRLPEEERNQLLAHMLSEFAINPGWADEKSAEQAAALVEVLRELLWKGSSISGSNLQLMLTEAVDLLGNEVPPSVLADVVHLFVRLAAEPSAAAYRAAAFGGIGALLWRMEDPGPVSQAFVCEVSAAWPSLLASGEDTGVDALMLALRAALRHAPNGVRSSLGQLAAELRKHSDQKTVASFADEVEKLPVGSVAAQDGADTVLCALTVRG